MKSLAEFSYRHRWLVLLAWVALLVGAFALSFAFGGEFKTEFKLPGSESQEALDLLEERGVNERTGFFGQVVFRADQGVDDPEVRAAMQSFFDSIERDVEGVDVVSPYDAENAHQIADGGQIAYAEINFSDRSSREYTGDADIIKDVRDDVELQGLQVELGGFLFAEQPEFSSEFVGIAAAVIILLIAFGSLLAMGLPIITALFGVGTGAALIGLVTRLIDVPEFTTSVAAMIGIGVGIDYALFIVTRYRQGLRDGLDPQQAVTLSLDTSGRAVLFAGITVVIALLGMFMLNLEFVRSIAIACVLAVFLTMVASLTLLPALLGFTGRNIDRFGLPHKEAAEESGGESIWYKWSRVIQGHPWPAFLLSAAVLIVLALPVFWLRLGFGDSGNYPESDTTRRAYDVLAEGFGPGFNGSFIIVAETPNGESDVAALDRLKTAIESTEGVSEVTAPQSFASGTIHLFNVYPDSAPQDEETTELVHRIRNDVVPSVIEGDTPVIRLTGDAPGVVDFADYITERLPLFIGSVLVLSFLLLMLVFHSIVVAAKAVIMNLLSIAAAFGAMVAVFQWGIGANLIGLGREGPIEAWTPMMLFAILFGLSMDYEVFLLSRIREEYDRTGDNARAVADGLAATGRVISAAAAIMVCVFGAFVLGGLRDLKLFGFGLAFAIFIDATVVRLVLVPAVMELMGKWNWYLPPFLRWLPVLRVEPDSPAQATPAGRLAQEAGTGGD
ncbi:MAG: MMPL family transporter [Dehalococcoidia bacterium]